MFSFLPPRVAGQLLPCLLLASTLRIDICQRVALGTADNTNQVRLVIERVTALDSLDLFGSAEFYALITINGQTLQTPVYSSDDDIQPNWAYVVSVPADTRSVPVRIALWEDDGIFDSDDHVDIRGSNGRDLDLVVDLELCTIGGDISGTCAASLISSGAEDNRARIQASLSVTKPSSPAKPPLYLPFIGD